MDQKHDGTSPVNDKERAESANQTEQPQMNQQQRDAEMFNRYFTPEFLQKVRELSHDDMVNLLKELEDTPYWTAIVKYNNQRSSLIQQQVLVMDPVQNPTQIARNQGTVIGLLDLQNAVIALVSESKEQTN